MGTDVAESEELLNRSGLACTTGAIVCTGADLYHDFNVRFSPMPHQVAKPSLLQGWVRHVRAGVRGKKLVVAKLRGDELGSTDLDFLV